MKSRYSVKWMLVGALLSFGLTACSSGEEEEVVEEVEVSEDGEEVANAEGNEDGTEFAGAENVNEENLAAGSEFENADAGGNVAETEFANSDLSADLTNTETAAANPAGDPLMDPNFNIDPAANAAPVSDPVPMAAEAAPMDAEAAAAPAILPSGDMRVYYVNVASLALKDSPSGQSVGTLTKGDPVLVKIEGDWANVLNRGYVETASLSQAPVGREMLSKGWQ